MNNSKIMRTLFVSILFVISLCPICEAQEKEIDCIIVIDQRLPSQLEVKCFFGEEYKDSIEMGYLLGELMFIDNDKKLEKYLKSEEDTAHLNSIRLCFDIDRLVGRNKIEKRRYCTEIPAIMFVENYKHPDALLICEIITLNRKKDRYLFYVMGDGYQTARKDKKGVKIHRKMFPAANTPF